MVDPACNLFQINRATHYRNHLEKTITSQAFTNDAAAEGRTERKEKEEGKREEEGGEGRAVSVSHRRLYNREPEPVD